MTQIRIPVKRNISGNYHKFVKPEAIPSRSDAFQVTRDKIAQSAEGPAQQIFDAADLVSSMPN